MRVFVNGAEKLKVDAPPPVLTASEGVLVGSPRATDNPFRYGVRFYGQLDDVRFSKWTVPFVSKSTTMR